MKVFHKAYGIAAVLLLAAVLGFYTPAANGSSFFLLPLALLAVGVLSGAFGLVGQYGPLSLRTWVAERF